MYLHIYRDASWNEFKDADLSQLPRSLEVLYIGDTKVQKLPEDFSSLTNLTELYVVFSTNTEL